MIDIYVSIVSDHTNKIIVHVNEFEYMTNLVQKIKDNLELKYEHLRGLNGLEPKELKRITGLDFNRGPASVSRALKNPMTFIGMKGRVNENLRPNDHLMCDVESHDIWIKLKLMIEAPGFGSSSSGGYVEVDLEVKIDRGMDAQMFQKVIQRLIIQIWNQHVQDKIDAENESGKKMEQQNYVLTEFRLVSIDMGTALQLADLQPQTSSKDQNRSATKNRKSKKTLFSMPENMTVGEVFQYQNNLVKVSCHFLPLREMFFQQVMGGAINVNYSTSTNIESRIPVMLQNMSPKNDSKNNNIKFDNRATKKLFKFSDNPKNLSSSGKANSFIQEKSPVDEFSIEMNQKPKGTEYQYIELDQNQETDTSKQNTTGFTQERTDSFDFIEEEIPSKYKPMNVAKIPRMTNRITTNANNHTSSAGHSNSMIGIRPPQFNSEEVDDAPDFGGNKTQTSASQNNIMYLFAVIQGYIVLPKRNPVAVAEDNIQNDQSQMIKGKTNQDLEESDKFQEIKVGRDSSRQSSSYQNNLNPLLNAQLKLSKIEEENDDEDGDQSASFVQPRRLLNQNTLLTTQSAQNNQEEQTMEFARDRMSTKVVRVGNDGQIPRIYSDVSKARTTVINDSLTETEENDVIKPTDQFSMTQQNSVLDVGSSFQPIDENLLRHSDMYDKRTIIKKKTNPDDHQNDLLQPLIDDLNQSKSQIEGNNSSKNDKRNMNRHTTMLQPKHFAMVENVIDPRKSSYIYINKQQSGQLPQLSNIRDTRKLSVGKIDINNQKYLDNNTKTQPKKQGGLKIFNFFTKLVSNQKNMQKLTAAELGLDQISEFEILQKIQLPSFLLFHEDYQLIQMPPVKNFSITEKEKNTSQSLKEQFGNDRDEAEFNEDGVFSNGSSKKNFIIVSIIVFLAAVFSVGIYYAVDLSNQQ